MKYCIIFLFTLCTLIANEIELTPVQLDFNRIEARNDTILTYGDYGSLLVSYDAAITWQQVKAFDKGVIQHIFWDDKEMIAFSDVGDVAVSSDGAASWKTVASLNDSVFAIIRFPKGYFIRSDKKIFTITNDYRRIDELLFTSGYIAPQLPYQYRKSAVWFKGSFILCSDFAKYYKINEQLEIIDSISLTDLGLCGKCVSNYQIDTDSENIYFKMDYIVYRAKNLKNIDTFFVSNPNYIIHNLINNKFYIIHLKSKRTYILSLLEQPFTDSIVSEFELNEFTSNYKVNDLSISDDTLYFSGNRKLIGRVGLNENAAYIISDFSGYSYSIIPYKFNESQFLFNSCNYIGQFFKYIYKTKNFGTTFNPTIDTNNRIEMDSYNYYFKYFDSKNKLLYLGGTKSHKSNGGVLISIDTAKTFIFVSLPNYNFETFFPYLNFTKLNVYPNIFVNDSSFVISSNSYYNKAHTSIQTYNKDFKMISIYRDSNYVIGYVNSLDTNTFLIHCLNTNDNCFEIKHSSDKGKSWEIIKKYKESDSLFYYKELKINYKNYLILFNYNQSDSVCSFEALDIEARTVHEIYNYKDEKQGFEIAYRNAFDSDSNILYLAINDTIYYTSDIFDRTSWKKYLLPKGAVVMRTFKKFGDRFYARYKDTIRKDNIYWIKILPDTAKYESPSILAGDCDFGEYDIRRTDYKIKKIRIENKSKDSSLAITGYSKFNDTVFTATLPAVSQSAPLSIEPLGFYEFEVTFKPKDSVTYKDSIVFYSNAAGDDNVTYLTGKGIDTSVINSVEDSKTEETTYLFIYPPYPVPSGNSVKALIYWDPRVNIDDDEIGVMNASGCKIEGRGNITIDKLTPYSGFLTWNCAGVTSGIYFIHIKHGNNSRLIKTVISR